MSTLRICQIIGGDCHQIGGLEKHFIDLCNALADRTDCQVTALGHPLYIDHLRENIKFIPLDLSCSRFNPIALWRIFHVLREEGYDIVHTHANKATMMLAMLKRINSFHLVSTLHGLKKNVKAFRRPDHVICVSQKISEMVKNQNISVIYNGIPCSYEVSKENKSTIRQKFNIDPTAFLVVSIGRLVEVKGFDLLLRAFVGVDAHLLIVGDGPEMKKLQKQVFSLKLKDQVTFAGFQKNVKSIIKSADLTVIASRREGFSYVMAETLTHSCPLISTDVADIRSIIGSTFIVPPNSVKKLHDKLIWAVVNSSELSLISDHAFSFARQEFTLDTMVTKTLDVYRKVLEFK
ncbi:MAG: glycosyltransferase family 4 protein [Desulfuromusa sp.]|nr:glycosyltransferase family 4 protein [Desulfuromusa sp.]